MNKKEYYFCHSNYLKKPGTPAFLILLPLKKLLLIIPLICLLFFSWKNALATTQFDELDKPPEGAHKGQMLAGGFGSIGTPYGSIIDSEIKFLENNTYTFKDIDTTKKLMISHRSYSFGLFYEYMFFDFVGARTKLKSTYIIQKTMFGPDYKNWSGYLYHDYSFFIGPAFHLTERKRWDVVLTPVIGYSFINFEATPVLPQVDSTYPDATARGRKQSMTGMAYGAELSMVFYFTGGLFISFGVDWTLNSLNFNKNIVLNQTVNGNTVAYKGGSSDLHMVSFIFSVGYAFSN